MAQRTLLETMPKKWGFDHPEEKRINALLVEMIAIDDVPFNVVNRKGFRRYTEGLNSRYHIPSNSYLSKTATPACYDNIVSQVQVKIENISHMSFTTDIWSNDSESFLSLTVHWVTDEFVQGLALLQVAPMTTRHTGPLISDQLGEIFRDWGITLDQVHMIVRDNGANMVSAMKHLNVKHVGCLSHTLQLVIEDSIFSQRAVSDIIAIARSLAGHFNHSTLAKGRLTKVQQETNSKVQAIPQDVKTRWNSTYYLLAAIQEQKRALTVYILEYKLDFNFTGYQWELISKVVATLEPIEEVTNKLSLRDANSSEYLPLCFVLRSTLSDPNTDDKGIQTMRETMLAALNKRMKHFEKDEYLNVAMLLDARYKDRLITTAAGKAEARGWLKKAATRITPEAVIEQPVAAAGLTVCHKSSVDTAMDKLLKSSEVQVQQREQTTISQEMTRYFNEPLSPISGRPLAFWKVNAVRFPALARVAKCYLCAPPTSVEAERVFSAAGNVYDAKRNKLPGEKAEMLLFIKYNVK